MKPEAVTVCVGYGDFLEVTAPLNMHHFRRWVVVTSPEDEETFEVCHKYNIEIIRTNDFKRDGTFNKGRGIQRGLNNLSCSDWVVHLDADIVLPHTFASSLTMAHIDPHVIYGCDRMMVYGWCEWQKILASGYHQHGRHCYVLPHDKYKIGTRWASPTDGYVPIGFFQLFHHDAILRKGMWQRGYLYHHGEASRSDVQFGLQWDRRNRALIPELLVWHLESEKSPIGTNWKGRRSPRFGPAAGDDCNTTPS